MANNEKKSLQERLSGLLQGAQIGQLNIIDGNVNELCYKKETAATDKKPATPLTHEELAKAVVAVQTYMWGASAYAVLFCECRDHRGYPNNKSQFEREVDAIAQKLHLSWGCRPGTLSDAFCDNPYYNCKVDKWRENGAKERSLFLLEKFQTELP